MKPLMINPELTIGKWTWSKSDNRTEEQSPETTTNKRLRKNSQNDNMTENS